MYRGGAARHEEMSFNVRTGVGGQHMSSVSAYSGNKIPVEESFHQRRNQESEGLGEVARGSYNLATTGKERISSINGPNGNAGD